MRISVDNKLKIGAAVSGGADSMVMLDLLKNAGANVTVINVEHGIRGEDSLRDSGFVAEYCEKIGVRCLLYKVDAPDFAKSEGVSIELAARILRYTIFTELLNYGTFDAIALAHHRDDQTETVLMRLFRGTGVRGLRGITDRDGYIHPLLPYSKNDILCYAKENGIPYIEDATNYDSAYTRNFLRHEVIPLIEKRYPSLNSAIYRMSENFCELEDYLLSEITPFTEENGIFCLPLKTLDRHKAIAKKSVAECLRAMGIDKDIEYTHLEAVCGLKDASNNSLLNLPFGIDVRKEYDKLVFLRREEKESFFEPFDMEKTYRFKGFSYSFAPCKRIEKCVFDADKIPEGAVIRTRQTGDSFKRFAGGRKPLSEYLTDIKMPARIRDSLLVLAYNNDILAVLGVETADGVKVDDNTKKIYKIYKSEDQ